MNIIKTAYIWMNKNAKIVALCWVALCLPAMFIPGTIAGLIALAIAVFALGGQQPVVEGSGGFLPSL